MKRYLLPSIFLVIIVLSFSFFNFKNKEDLIQDKGMSMEEFNKITSSKDKSVLVYFNASWCTLCAKMRPVMEQIESEYQNKLEVLKIDTDKNKEVANEFEIDALPVLILYNKGYRQWIYIGIIEKEKLKAKLNHL